MPKLAHITVSRPSSWLAERIWRWLRHNVLDVLGGPHGISRVNLLMPTDAASRAPLLSAGRARVMLEHDDVFQTRITLPEARGGAHARMLALQVAAAAPMDPDALVFGATSVSVTDEPRERTYRLAMVRRADVDALDTALRRRGWSDVEFATPTPGDAPPVSLISRRTKARRRRAAYLDIGLWAVAGLSVLAAAGYATAQLRRDAESLRAQSQDVRSRAVALARSEHEADAAGRVLAHEPLRQSIGAVMEDVSAAARAMPQGAVWRSMTWEPDVMSVDIEADDALAVARAFEQVFAGRARIDGAVTVLESGRQSFRISISADAAIHGGGDG